MITDIELSYHTEAWTDEDFVAALRQVGRRGFSGVEVLPEVAESFGDRVHVFREMLDDVGLRLSAVESMLPTLTEENVEENGLRLLRLASFSKSIGADVVIVRPPIRTKRDLDEDEWKLFTAFLTEVGKEITGRDMRFCVRPEIDTIVEKRTEIDYLMDATPKSTVKLAPDTSHMLVVKIAPPTLFKQYANRLGYVRVLDGRLRKPLKSTWRRRVPSYRAVGKGAINLRQIIQSLDKVEYEGWICASHPPPVPDSGKACADAMDALEKAMDHLF